MKYLCFIFLLIFSTNTSDKSISYVESSTGLGYPQLDGGTTEMEFADINGDGYIDILSIGDHGSPYINTDEHGIMVWFGDGNGNWSVFQNGNFGYGGIAVGDVNNDNLLDVGYGMHHDYSSTDFGDQLLEVALGDGTGMNWIPWDDGLATNGETWGMSGTDFADVDNDGDLDIGSISFGSGAGVHVYLNQMDGSWTQSFGFLNGNSDNKFDFGDINNDGNMDFVVAHEYGTAYFGDGAGNFILNDNNLPSSGGWYGRRGTSLGDVDNDGGMDLAFINDDDGVEVWIWNEWDEIWNSFSGELPYEGDYNATQLFDMNIDGFVDVVAFGGGTFTLWLGDGSGNWYFETQFTTPSPGYCEAFRVGNDIDNNGYPDIILVADEGSWPSDKNHLHCFKENSSAQLLIIKPIYPRGNENIRELSIRNIKWISAVPNNEPSYVKLELSLTGDNGPWFLISDSLPNNGTYQWNVPETSSTNCFIKYSVFTTDNSITAITPAAFTILGVSDINNKINPQDNISIFTNPNPFSQEIKIKINLKSKGKINAYIYNLKGQKVKTLANNIFVNKTHSFNWEGTNEFGAEIKKGIYLMIIEHDQKNYQKKIVFTK